MAEPGPLIGRGRAADVFDIGGGRVLRRYREVGGRDGHVVIEAAAMRHLAAHGFPVPAVHDADGVDLVMERLDGASMLTALERGPWRLGRHADLWADAPPPAGGRARRRPRRRRAAGALRRRRTTSCTSTSTPTTSC